MIVGHVHVVHTALARPPKDKISLCVAAADSLFLWINTTPRYHMIGQVQLAPGDHPALTRVCDLDCSRVTTFPPGELAAARDRGPVARVVAERIVGSLLALPPKTLPLRYLKLIVANLGTL